MANRLAQQFIMPADVVYTDVPNTFTGWPQRLTVNNPSNNTSTFIVTNTNSAGQAAFEADNDAGVGASLGVFGSTFGAGLANVASVGASAGLCVMTDYNTTTGTDPITFRVGGYDSSNERMRLTSTGNLLLGTTTSIASTGVGLAVQAASGQLTALTQWRDSAGSVLASVSPVSDNGSPTLLATSNYPWPSACFMGGPVGIGTMTPNGSYGLVVPAGASLGNFGVGVGLSNSYIWHAGDNRRFFTVGGAVGQAVQIGSPDGIGFCLNGAGGGSLSTTCLTSTGALGLGTTTPGAQLTINNTAPDTLTPFVQDTFTVSGTEVVGEELTAHHGERGATWSAQDNTEGEADITAAGRLRLGGSRGTNYWFTRYQALGTPSSPDYTVSADFYLASLPTTTTDWSLALTGRQTSPNTYYQMEYDYAGTWNLSRVVNGAGTTLGSAPASFAVGATHNVALVMQGTQLSAQVDGVTVIGPITDTSITAAGTVGFWMWLDQNSGFVPGDAAGMQLDNFSAIELAPPTVALVQNNGVTGATIDAAGNVVTSGRIEATGAITTSGLLRAPGAAIRVGHATDMGLTIKSALGQSANLLQFQDSNGGALSYIDSGGNLSCSNITFWSRINPGLGGSIYTENYPGISPGSTIHTTQHTINMWAWNASDVVLSISGSPGHTANLQEWLDSSQNVLANITAAGNLQLGAASPKIQWLRSDISNSNSLTFQPYGTDQDAVVNVTPNGTSTNAAVVLHTDMAMAGGEAKLAFGGGASGMRAGTFSFASVVDSAPSGLSRDLGFMISNGTLGRSERLTIQASTGNVGVGTITPNAGLHVLPPGASTVGLSVQGVANQAIDLQQWLASDGSVLSALSHDGTLTTDRLSVTGATTIKSENWDSVTAPAIPAGWTVDSLWLRTATTNSPTSAPNSLVYPAAAANGGAVPMATWNTPDGNNGDVQVSATFRFANASGAGEQDLWVYARGATLETNTNFGQRTDYSVAVSMNPVNAPLATFVLDKNVNGVTTHLGYTSDATLFVAGTSYRVFLVCHGSTIQARCQRLSDGYWLSSSYTWVSDPTNSTVAISVTDTSVVGAGYAGVGTYLQNALGGDIGVDDWLLERAGNTAPVAQIATSNPMLVPLVIKSAGGQVSDIQQWQDATGAVIGRVFNGTRGPTITSDNVQANSWGLQFTDGNGIEHFRIQTSPTNTLVYQPVDAYAPITITQSTATPALVGVANYNADLVSLTRGGGAGAMISVNQTAGQCTAFSATTTSGAYLQNNPNTIFYGNGTYQHTGAPGLGRGLDLTVTNNVGDTGTLYGALINATANTAGATALGLAVSAASSAGASTVAQFVCGSPTTVGASVQASAGQSADLTQWVDSTGAVMARVTSFGTGVFNSVSINANNYIVDSTNNGPFILIGTNAFTHFARSATQTPIVVHGAYGGQTADLQRWEDGAGAVLAKVDAYGDIYTSGGTSIGDITGVTNATLGVSATNINNVVLAARAKAGQVADIFQAQDGAGGVLAKVDSQGNFFTSQAMVVGGLTGGAGYFNVTTLNAADPAVTVTGHAGQVADLQQWLSSTSVVLAKIDATGNLSAAGLATSYAEKTGNYTLTTNDGVVVASTNNLTLTLPAASAVPAGRYFVVANDNCTGTTVTAGTGDTVIGQSSYNLTNAWNSIILVSNGSHTWRVV